MTLHLERESGQETMTEQSEYLTKRKKDFTWILGWGVVGFVLFLAALMVLSSMFILSPDRGYWYYAPGYSDEKFAGVKKGMTQAQVTAILGKPLGEIRWEDRLYRVKTEGGKIVAVVLPYYNGTVNYYSKESPVASARRIRTGMTQAEAEAALHTKSSKLLGYRREWQYSRGQGATWDYHTRDVVFGYDGTVKEINRYDAENSD